MRHQSFQRHVIAFILFFGLFVQFQLVFACEYKDGKLQLLCCCNETGDESGGMSKDCAQGDKCSSATGSSNNCCNVSINLGPNALSTSSHLHNPQVLLLEAPQPPPLVSSIQLRPIVTSNKIIQNTDSYLAFSAINAGNQTYLRTLRLRI